MDRIICAMILDGAMVFIYESGKQLFGFLGEDFCIDVTTMDVKPTE